MKTAEIIREARLKAGLSQKELGTACGCSDRNAQSTVARWESGNRPIPKNKMLTVSRLLNIPLESLLYNG